MFFLLRKQKKIYVWVTRVELCSAMIQFLAQIEILIELTLIMKVKKWNIIMSEIV